MFSLMKGSERQSPATIARLDNQKIAIAICNSLISFFEICVNFFDGIRRNELWSESSTFC